MTTQKLDWEKLKAVVHYVCNKANDPSVLGSIKLNKVLWYSDTMAYLVWGRSITGETYVKRQHGPVPKHILSVVEQLSQEGKVKRGTIDYFGYMKKEFISIAEPALSLISAEEIGKIDAAFEYVCLQNTARSISEETHGAIWALAEIGEHMPHAAVFAAHFGEVDESDIEWAKGLIKEAA